MRRLFLKNVKIDIPLALIYVQNDVILTHEYPLLLYVLTCSLKNGVEQTQERLL